MAPAHQAPGGTIIERQLVTWAAGIAAAAAIGYIVLGNYFPTFGWSRKTEKDIVPGLYNRYGNDCFANCVVQSLAGIPSFRKYLQQRVENDVNQEMRLSKSLMELLAVLNLPAGKEKTRSVESVIIALEKMYNSRISRNQQDSQEFLHLIHEALSLEDTKLKNQHPNPEALGIPGNPFEGELSTQIECQRCGFTTPWKKEVFTELSVAWSCTLLECLGSLITTDPIPDYACPSCIVENTLLKLESISSQPTALQLATSRLRDILKEVKSSSKPVDLDIDTIKLPANVEWKIIKVPAIKRTTVSKAPRVMAVHLVRSVYERGYGAGRNGCEVTFEEELSIPIGVEAIEQRKQETDEDEEEVDFNERYRLMSVVTHKGVHDNGHYICYRRRKRIPKPKRPHPEPSSSSETEGGVMVEVREEKVEDGVDKGEESSAIVASQFEEGDMRIEQPDSRTKWWEISDDIVNGVTRSEVLSKRKGVYILFYERAS